VEVRKKKKRWLAFLGLLIMATGFCYFEKNHTSMVVSRGLGNSIIPLRIFNRPELVEIRMK